MNQLFCHPEIITLKKAVYYDIAPIPLPVPFKDGTGGVRHASFFKGWMKIYDEDGFCGQGPAGPLMTDFFLPRMLDVPGKMCIRDRSGTLQTFPASGQPC